MAIALDDLEARARQPLADPDLAQVKLDSAITLAVLCTGGAAIEPASGTITVDPDGTDVILLREHMPLRAVTAVRVEGDTLDPDDYWWWRRGKILNRRHAFPREPRTVEIDAEWGPEETPEWLVEIVCGAVLRSLNLPEGAPGSVQSETWGAHTLAFMSGNTGSGGDVVGYTVVEERRLAAYAGPIIA